MAISGSTALATGPYRHPKAAHRWSGPRCRDPRGEASGRVPAVPRPVVRHRARRTVFPGLDAFVDHPDKAKLVVDQGVLGGRVRCSRRESPLGRSSTATATLWPTTCSASPTGPGFLIVWSPTTSPAMWTSLPTSHSSPWISNTWARRGRPVRILRVDRPIAARCERFGCADLLRRRGLVQGRSRRSPSGVGDVSFAPRRMGCCREHPATPTELVEARRAYCGLLVRRRPETWSTLIATVVVLAPASQT
jgi:hypothetical protein